MTDFPAYKIYNIESLIPYARNARTHSDEQIGKIAASIKEFGFINPIVVDGDNGIVAGHGRVMAAKRLGMKELPVIEAAHLSDAQRRAYVIADNRLAEDAAGAGWDQELLAVELQELDESGFSVELVGFDLHESEQSVDSSEDNVDFSLRYQVVVECDDEAHQGRMLDRLEKEGLKCRPLIL